MIVLLDSDIVTYRVGFTTNNVSEEIAIVRTRDTVDRILSECSCSEYRCFLTKSRADNFRVALYPAYKANREHMPKPIHYDAIRQYLVEQWGATYSSGQEADDDIGIASRNLDLEGKAGKWLIASIDKDFKQIAGKHYNFVTKEFNEYTEIEGWAFFWGLFALGDNADNIPHSPGFGPTTLQNAMGLSGLREGSKHVSEKRGVERGFPALQLPVRPLVSTFSLAALFYKQGVDDVDVLCSEIQTRGKLLHILRSTDENYNCLPEIDLPRFFALYEEYCERTRNQEKTQGYPQTQKQFRALFLELVKREVTTLGCQV